MARRPAPAVDWEGLFRQWRSSGLTQDEFCVFVERLWRAVKYEDIYIQG
jgi:hypothetical protein